MKIKPIGHRYTIVPLDDGRYRAVMIISEHDNFDDAIGAMLEAMDMETDEIMKREIEELEKQGIKAVSFKETVKDMTPEQLERFLEERNRIYKSSSGYEY